MKIFMVIALLAVSACTGKGVDGFQELKWGMTQDQVKSIWPKVTSTKTKDGGLDVLIDWVHDLGGEKGVARAYFLEGKLAFVSNIVGDPTPATVKSYFDKLESKYGPSSQHLPDYELQALKLGLNQSLYKSWQDDTIVLTTEDVMGQKRLLLIYRRKGINEELRKLAGSKVKGL